MNTDQGSVLIVVLVLSLTITMIALFSLETNIVQTKMGNNFRSYISTFIQTELNLHKAEKELILNVAVSQEKEQFVADTLTFGERHGISYHKLRQSTVGIGYSEIDIVSRVAIRHSLDMP